MRRLLNIILICLPYALWGQAIKPLSIGDQVPDVYLSSILNHHTRSTDLSEFLDKPLIIDFWFRECGACIDAMPHLDSLQNEFRDELNIILSTYQNREKIEDFYNHHYIGQRYKFINVVGDTILSQLFPATSFPHQVWVDKNGVVYAITSGESATRENVKIFLEGKQSNLKVKKDETDFNMKNGIDPLITYFGDDKELILQYSFLGKYRKGMKSGANIRTDTANNITRVSMMNLDFLRLYDRAYNPPMGSEDLHRGTRIVRLDSNPIQTSPDYTTFTNIFCYDLIYQGKQNPEKQKDIMVADLDRSFNVKSSLEIHTIPCYVLKEIGTSKRYQNILFPNTDPFNENKRLHKNLKWITNDAIVRFVVRDANKHADKPFIFEGDDSKRINFKVTWNPDDLHSMNNELREYDLELIVEEREREVIVLRDR